MSEIKFSSALPKGSANGLGPIVLDMCQEPTKLRVVLAVVDCKAIETNTDTGEIIPTARIRRIEAITGEDKVAARRLMERAVERRTGRTMLPLDVEEGIPGAFDIFDGRP